MRMTCAAHGALPCGCAVIFARVLQAFESVPAWPTSRTVSAVTFRWPATRRSAGPRGHSTQRGATRLQTGAGSRTVVDVPLTGMGSRGGGCAWRR